MKLRYLTHYAFQSLRITQRRLVVALLAVAFGVMSLVGMISVSESISAVLLIDPRYEIGGDAWLWRDSRYLSPADLAQIEGYAASGNIAQWAPISDSSTLLLKTPGSGRVTFLRDGIGFEPGTYPLVGEIILRSGASLSEVLLRPGDVVVTRDIAAERDLHVGDAIIVGNRLGGSGETFRIVGIATQTPAYHGSTIYYDLETAALLTGRPDPITNVAIRWQEDGNGGETRAALENGGWRIYAPDSMSERTREMRSTLSLMLKGAGILGLMVGGIGIANTVHVLLTRRRAEIAVLKSLGYARRDILWLFLIETALLGLLGSLLGVVAGVGLSALLVQVASNVVTLFINWRFDPWLMLGGLAVGVVTTILFAADTILRAGDVRPTDVFRQLPLPPRRRLRSVATLIATSLPFGAIASLILRSVWQSVIVLVAALAGLLLIGGTLVGIQWLAVRLLPTFRFHMLRVARNNLRHRGASMIFAMIALCIGSFTLGLSMIIIRAAQEQLELQLYAAEGYNLVVLTDPSQGRAAQAVVRAVSENTGLRYEAPLQTVTTDDGRDLSEQLGTVSLQGREHPWDVTITGAPWHSLPDAAYLPAGLDGAGERITVTDFDGTRMTLTVAGAYSVTGQWDRALLPEPEGVLVSAKTLQALHSDDAFALAAAEIPLPQLESAAQQVSAAVPEMMVTTAADMNKSFKSTFRNLSIFATAMAGLALMAGAVLIANAVSLAMIERRHEIGVMKAVGYTRGQVLRTILLEYGIVGSIASGMGLLGVVVFLLILTYAQEITAGVLTMSGSSGLLILAVAVGLTLAAALATAWGPASLRPAFVLDESS